MDGSAVVALCSLVAVRSTREHLRDDAEPVAQCSKHTSEFGRQDSKIVAISNILAWARLVHCGHPPGLPGDFVPLVRLFSKRTLCGIR